jgi:uncharacterized membrane protein
MTSIQNKVKIKTIFSSYFAPIILVFINFILKIRYVTYPSLALDEPFSVYYSQFNINTIISKLSLGNNTPLYEIFLHFWTYFFGISELSVRFPSIIFSSLSVYFIYKICHKFFNLKVAILASLFFTFSNYQLYFAHEARVYPLFMLLAIISMYQYLKLISIEYSKIDVIIYIVINVLLLYSHFFSLFVIFVQFSLLIFFYIKKKKEFWRFLKYFGIIFTFYIPYIGIIFNRFLDSSNGTWIESVNDLRPIHTFIGILINNSHLGYTVFLLFIWIFLQSYITKHFKNKYIQLIFIFLSIISILLSLSIRLPMFPFEINFSSPFIIIPFIIFYLVLFTCFQSNENHSIQYKIIVSWLFIPGFIMFTISFYIPMFIDRYLIYFTPAFYIIFSIALSKFDNKYFISLSLLTITLMVITFNPISNNERDVKALVKNVKEMHKNSNSAVFICPDYFGFNFAYYYNKNYFIVNKNSKIEVDLIDSLHSDNIFLVKNFHSVDSIYKANNFNKIIYVDAAADFSYSNNNIKNYLNKLFRNKSVSIDSMYVPGIFNIYKYEYEK